MGKLISFFFFKKNSNSFLIVNRHIKIEAFILWWEIEEMEKGKHIFSEANLFVRLNE